MTFDIEKNLDKVESRIQLACKNIAINRNSIKLIAVSKKKPVEYLAKAIDLGLRYFGENYVQEAVAKIKQLEQLGHPREAYKMDLIGPLQSNKAKEVVGVFDCVQTVDRSKIAQALNKFSEQKNISQNILIQVNISDEDSKSGVALSKLDQLVEEVIELKNLSLKGLMSIGNSYSKEEFDKMFLLKKQIERRFKISLPDLSMGMSEDFELAIECGANNIRVGSAIFGER